MRFWRPRGAIGEIRISTARSLCARSCLSQPKGSTLSTVEGSKDSERVLQHSASAVANESDEAGE
jgi:hypothetical protein